MIWFRKILFIGFLCSSHLALSQTFTNPLDIQGREPDAAILQDSSYQETIQNIQGNGTMTPSSSSTTNPFDVSHIPLKKTEVAPSAKRTKKANGSTLNPQQSSSKERMSFMLWVMMGLLFFFAAIMFFFREQVFLLVKPFFNLNYLKTYNRETSGGRTPFLLCLYLFFLLNFGVLIYNYIHTAVDHSSGLKLYGMIIAVMLGVYTLKHLYIYFIKWVYPLQNQLSNYGFSIVVMHAIVGILLFPVNILIVFGPENWSFIMVNIGLLLVVIFYVMRLIKGFQLSARISSNNILHFFLYLCGSEIAPIALVFGLITQGF